MVYADDGAHLTEAMVRPTVCEECGNLLHTEPWWVTKFPRGVHTRCRDWARTPFPLKRQLDVTRKLSARLDGEAQVCATAAMRWIARRERHWPQGGAQTVLDAFAMLRRLRTKLSALGVSQKLLNQL